MEVPNICSSFDHDEIDTFYSTGWKIMNNERARCGKTDCDIIQGITSHLPVGLRNNTQNINPLNAELNPICYLLALLGAHHFLHVSRIRIKLLTFRRLMSYIYIYMEHPFLMFLDHTQRRSTVGRTPLDE